MNRAELIARCLPILGAAKAGSPVEDSFVELKSELPEDKKVARSIAGMANAAQGENIIWLIGIDEKTGTVVGCAKKELSEWYPRLSSFFDGPAPELLLVENIPIEGNTVVAMAFDTSDAPYVFQTGSDSRQVPWREGNRTICARRSSLIRMLAPASIVPVPQVDVVSAGFQVERDVNNKPSRVKLIVGLYVKPRSDRLVVFPRHECSVSIMLAGEPGVRLNAKDVWLIESMDKGGRVPPDLAFSRPGPCVVMAFFDPTFEVNGDDATAIIELTPVGAAGCVTITHALKLSHPSAASKQRASHRKVRYL